MSARLRLSVTAAALLALGTPLLSTAASAAPPEVCKNGKVVNAYPPRSCKPPKPVTDTGNGGGGVTVPVTAGSGSGLPFTGLNAESLASDAGLLVAGGAVVLVLGRRRKLATA